MSTLKPAYRLTLYAPRSVDRTEATVLAPAAGAPHADPFQVASLQGLAGFQPYLDIIRGRRGKIDVLSKRTDAGELTVTLLDKRVTTGGSNLSRWVTGFTGDAKGRHALAGYRVVIDESLDGGATFATFWTGRVQKLERKGQLRYFLTVRDMREDLKMKIGVGTPHPSAAGVVRATVLPPGIAGAFGLQPGIVPLRAKILLSATQTVQGVTFKRAMAQCDAASLARVDNLITANLLTLEATVQQELTGLAGIMAAARGRVHVKRVDTSAEGDFVFIGTLNTVQGTVGVAAAQLFFSELATTEPGYLVMPPDGTTIDWYVWTSAPATPAVPILITDTHPVQVWKDILDGYYGFRWLWAERESLPAGVNLGDPQRTVAYDTAAFATLIADARFPKARFLLTQAPDAWDWIEKNILQPYGLGFYLDATGKVVPIDLRLPVAADLAGVPTLTDADLIEAVDAVGWAHDRALAITKAFATFYVDTPVPPAALAALARQPVAGAQFGKSFPEFTNAMLSSVPSVVEILNLGNADLGDNAVTIDASGFRAMPGEQIDNQDRLVWLIAKLQTMLQHLNAPYGNGGVPIVLKGRRTANVTPLQPGKLFLGTLSGLPDPSTNLRGGTRALRCTARTEDGLQITIEAIDLGLNQTAATPTLGAPAQETGNTTNGASTAVTLNASSDPVEVQYAVTDPSVGSAPADGASLWALADVARSNRDVTVERLPAGTRIWFRGRSIPGVLGRTLLPSAYVAAGGTGRVDLATLAAPTAPTLVMNGGRTFTVGWTPGDVTRRTELLIASPTTDPMTSLDVVPAGQKTYAVVGVDPSTTYRVWIRHVDGFGGVSATVQIDVTTTGTTAVYAAIAAITVWQGG